MAMSEQEVAKLIIRLQADVGDVKQELAQVSPAMKKTGDSAKKTADDVEKVTTSFKTQVRTLRNYLTGFGAITLGIMTFRRTIGAVVTTMNQWTDAAIKNAKEHRYMSDDIKNNVEAINNLDGAIKELAIGAGNRLLGLRKEFQELRYNLLLGMAEILHLRDEFAGLSDQTKFVVQATALENFVKQMQENKIKTMDIGEDIGRVIGMAAGEYTIESLLIELAKRKETITGIVTGKGFKPPGYVEPVAKYTGETPEQLSAKLKDTFELMKKQREQAFALADEAWKKHIQAQEKSVEIDKDALETREKNERDFNEILKDLALTQDDIAEWKNQRELKRLEDEKKKREELINIYANYASQSFQIFDNIHQMRMNQIATEDQRERDSINANIKDEGARQRALEALSKKTETREREERERQKKWAILQAIINGAEAIVRLWSIPGFPAAIPLAAVVAGITASQIGVIQSQKFAEGGRVGGRLHSQGGTPVEAEKNEYIMSRRATAKYGFGAMEAVNQGRVDPRAFAAFAGMRPLQPVGYYGTGGRVTPPPASNDKGTVNIVNFLDPALFEQWMGTIDGKRAIVNTIRRNSYEIRKVINI